MNRLITALTLSLGAAFAHAEAPTRYSATLEGFTYPYPLQQFGLDSQGQKLSMAYLDVAAKAPANGRTVVLLHGKNFCAATWEQSIKVLSESGYRVIAPDQIGFCASSKPRGYQFSFNQLAHNTQALLAAKGVSKATVIGHSMGGMLAARYAINYPQRSSNWYWSTPSAWKTGRPPACPTPPSTSCTRAS